MTFNKEERRLLLELISNEQIHMLLKSPNKYKSEKYVQLEKLKARINECSNSNHPTYLDYKRMEDDK